MATVFSAQLFAAPGVSGGPFVQYTAPPGYLTVVRCISIVWGDITVSGLDAWVQSGNLTKLCRKTWALTFSDVTEYGGVLINNGRWAIEAGDTLSVQTAAGTCDIFASGYELKLP